MQTAKSAIVCGILETTVTPIIVLQPVSAATALSSSVSVASAIAATNDGGIPWAPYLCMGTLPLHVPLQQQSLQTVMMPWV